MIYCDASFLISLYFEEDRNHDKARSVASRFIDPIPYTFLCELEVTNTLRRLNQGGLLNSAELTKTLSQLERDVRDGLLDRCGVNQAALSKLALEISARREAIQARSLDILHVAYARLFSAEVFASFDARQRTLAREEGFNLLPVRV